MDNQRFILYVALAFVLFLIWQAWQEDHRAPASAAQGPVSETTGALSDEQAGDLPERGTMAGTDAGSSPTPERGGETATGETIRVTTDMLSLDISTRGGDILRADLLTYPVAWDKPDQPFPLLEKSVKRYIAQSGLVHDETRDELIEPWKLAPNHYAEFTSTQREYTLADGKDQLQVVLQWQGPNGVTVDKIFTFERGSFLIRLDQMVRNGGDQPWIGRQYRQLRHGPVQDDGSSRFIYTYTGGAYYDGAYEKVSFDDMADDPLYLQLTGGWIAILQHYFVSTWVAEPEERNLAYTKSVQGPMGPDSIIGLRSEPLILQPGETGTFSSRFFVGPKLQHQLAEIGEGLDLVVDYGIFTVISQPLFWLLEKINSFVGNWGWSIVLLTVLIKLVFYKLSETSYRSMAKMRAVQPRLMALKERYGDDKQKLNQAMMDMYRTEKINPLGGCLPIVVQIPVFIALYWTLLESVELRQAPFMLWIHDLATKDPYFVLPILMGITMVIQQKLNPAPLDPIQAKVMMVLPLVFTVFFAFFPSGLVLYWLTNNVLSILQQWVITRRIEQGKDA